MENKENIIRWFCENLNKKAFTELINAYTKMDKQFPLMNFGNKADVLEKMCASDFDCIGDFELSQVYEEMRSNQFWRNWK